MRPPFTQPVRATTAGPLLLRIGGNSQDAMVTGVDPSVWAGMAQLQAATGGGNISYSLGLNLKVRIATWQC